MGQWSPNEYERLLLVKIRQLFDYSLPNRIKPPVPPDRRFRMFIKNLDVESKAIQACFDSLIQQTCSAAEYRVERLLRAQHNAVTTGSSPTVMRVNIADFNPSSPGPMPNASGPPIEDVTSPVIHAEPPLQSNLTSPDPLALSPRYRRRSHSPSHSPSRLRNLRPRSRRSQSPTHPSSRSWLEEYSQAVRQPVGGNGEDGYASWTWPEDLGLSSYNDRVRRRAGDDLGDDTRTRRLRRMRIEEGHELHEWENQEVTDSSAGNPYLSLPSITRDRDGNRDTRRDGIVFEDYPPALPSSNLAVEDIIDLPYRRHTLPPTRVIEDDLLRDPISDPLSDIPDALWEEPVGVENEWFEAAPYIDFSLHGTNAGNGEGEENEGIMWVRSEGDEII